MAPPCTRAAPSRPQGPLCAGECRARIPTRGGRRRPSPRTGRGRTQAGSADGQGCLHRKAPPCPGGGWRPNDCPQGLRRTPRAVAHAVREPSTRPSPAASHQGVPWGRLYFQTTAPASEPPRRPRAAGCATKFPSARRAARLTWEPGHERAEPEEAGVQGRGGTRHGGAPGSAAACGGGRGAGAEGRGPRPSGRRGQLSWPAPCRHHPSRSALAAQSQSRRCAGSPAGTPGVSPLGTAPEGGSGQADRQALRYGGDSGSGTRPALKLPCAPAHSARRLRPFPSSLRPAGVHFPPLLSPPLLSPSRPPPDCHSVSLRRGGAARAPPRAGTGPRLEAEGVQVGAASSAPGGGGGGRNREVGFGGALVATGGYGKGAEPAPQAGGGCLELVNFSRESGSGEIVLRRCRPPRAGLVTARRRLRWGREGAWGVEALIQHTFPSLKFCPVLGLETGQYVASLCFPYLDSPEVSLKPNCC